MPDVPEQRTIDVDVEDVDTRGKTLHGYAAVYGATSDDLGGFRERIAPGAFRSVLDADVRALLNHDPSQVLGRTKSGTLRLFDEQRGLRFECDLPDSPLGENVKAAVRRGDIDGASFRFRVGEEFWDGDLRTVKSVAELKDVTVATYGAYPDASVELRTRPETTNERKDEMSEESTTSERTEEARSEDKQETEERQAPKVKVTSEAEATLDVEERTESPAFHSMTEAFRSRGFPSETGTLGFDEFRQFESRAVTWGGTIDALDRLQTTGGPYGYDARYVWNSVPNVAVDAGVTSVTVFQQTARTLNAGTAVVRAIDATSNKPEVASTLNVANVQLKQVAGVESGIPNVYLESDALASVVEEDLRYQVYDGLDSLFVSAVASSGFQAPDTGTANLTSIRKAQTTLRAAGYSPNLVALTPANAESMDLLVTGLSGGTADFVFGAGQFGPQQVFGMPIVVSKSVAASVVVDTNAHGKMYVSPISLARFEENAGKTNTSLVRLECNAQYGTERTAAAVRIAAS